MGYVSPRVVMGEVYMYTSYRYRYQYKASLTNDVRCLWIINWIVLLVYFLLPLIRLLLRFGRVCMEWYVRWWELYYIFESRGGVKIQGVELNTGGHRYRQRYRSMWINEKGC
jgi:hypothetical protein